MCEKIKCDADGGQVLVRTEKALRSGFLDLLGKTGINASAAALDNLQVQAQEVVAQVAFGTSYDWVAILEVGAQASLAGCVQQEAISFPLLIPPL